MESIGKEIEHESFGLIELSRISSSGSILVGSEVEHRHYFELRIKRAVNSDSFGEARWYGGQELIRVNLSANQLMDLFTGIGISGLVPCTLKAIQGQQMATPPMERSRVLAALEYGKGQIREESQRNAVAVASIMEKIASLSASKKREIEILLEQITKTSESNRDFYIKRIIEAGEQTITIAKRELENFTSSIVRTLGIKKLQEMAGSSNEMAGSFVGELLGDDGGES